jgi:hypothetical protein
MINGKSKYIGFFDECGDHSMEKIDKDFPIFVLCLSISKEKAIKPRLFQK